VLATKAGCALVCLFVAGAIGAPFIAPHSPTDRFPDLLNAPPTWPRVVDRAGEFRSPFVYGWTLVNRLEQRFEPDRSAAVPLRWFTGGRLLTTDDSRAPLLLLGADSFGRDVFSRLLFGARVSLALSILAALGSIAIGGFVGSISGYAGGATDEVLMKLTDVVLILPTMYVALALRAVLPLVIEPSTIFVSLVLIFAAVGAPFVARGVRAIVRSERQQEYAVAAISLGAGHARVLVRHVLPAAGGFLAVQATMLIPAFIVAEATLSAIGLGFGDSLASWGTMLQEASKVRTFADFPWLLSPAAAIFVFVLGLNLVLQRDPRAANLNGSFGP
jgi:peptide/nickel transport system permease protein